MPYYLFLWMDEVIEAEHGITQDDFLARPHSSRGRAAQSIIGFAECVRLTSVRCVVEKIKIQGRIQGKLTSAQKRRMKKVRAQIADELPELIRRNQLAQDPRKERTFSGALRRAVHASRWSPMKIADRVGIAWAELDDFLTAEKTLPSDVIDRLVKVLNLKVPASRGRGAARAS